MPSRKRGGTTSPSRRDRAPAPPSPRRNGSIQPCRARPRRCNARRRRASWAGCSPGHRSPPNRSIDPDDVSSVIYCEAVIQRMPGFLRTPHLDLPARQGTTFTRAYADCRPGSPNWATKPPPSENAFRTPARPARFPGNDSTRRRLPRHGPRRPPRKRTRGYANKFFTNCVVATGFMPGSGPFARRPRSNRGIKGFASLRPLKTRSVP